MLTVACYLLLGLLASAQGPKQPGAFAPTPDEQDRNLLAQFRIGTGGPELLGRLKNQVGDPQAMARARALIPLLGNEDFEIREKASRNLAGLGSTVLEVLRENSNHPDAEVARRVRDARESIEETQSSQVMGAIIRQLTRKKVPGTVEALMQLSEARGDPEWINLVERPLGRLASESIVALEKAATSATPRVRWLAGKALCQTPEGKAFARRLMKDPDHLVRWRVALALGRSGDEGASLPVVVQELHLANQIAGFEMEDWLHQVAGESGPAPLPWPGTAGGRAERQKAWEEWLGRRPVAKTMPNRTLTVLLDEGIVRMLDGQNQPIWELKNIAFPLDVEYLPGGRILVAEHGANRVTIRSSRNEVIWERTIEMPLAAQRTGRGTILITTAELILEVDGAGTEVARFNPDGRLGNGGTSIMKAQMLPGGELGLVTQRRELGEDAKFVRLDSDWREVGRLGVHVGTSGGRIDWQANGNVLVPELDKNRVVEYDPAGKELWIADAEVPVFAMRTPKGTTLMTSRSDAGAKEVDKKGATIWNYKGESRVTRAIRLP